MQKRNFGNLARTGSAGAANSGMLTDTAQKDRIVYLDPNTEIIYDPTLNVRNDPIVDDLEGLIELRQTIDAEEQMQPIRVYPLTPELLKKYGRKPTEKLYGIAIGHRRYLSCRLTNKDHPSLGPLPRKVMSLIDTTWLSKSTSEKLLYMLNENKKRKGLSHVEYGETIKRFQKERSQELGRHVTQSELQDIFNESAKTIGYLLQAASFEPVIKDLCRANLLADLDALVTLDGIAKKNLGFAQAICVSLSDPDAPRTRALIREAKALIDADPEYVVDESSWVWPDSVREHPANQKQKQAQPQADNPAQVQGVATPAPTASPQAPHSGEQPGQQPTVDAGSNEVSDPAPEVPAKVPTATGPTETPATIPATPPAAGALQSGQTGTGHADAAPAAREEEKSQAPGQGLPVIMVMFKMHADAARTFNGELVLDEPAKLPNLGVVAYLEDGKEKRTQVPLNLIQLLSIGR